MGASYDSCAAAKNLFFTTFNKIVKNHSVHVCLIFKKSFHFLCTNNNSLSRNWNVCRILKCTRANGKGWGKKNTVMNAMETWFVRFEILPLTLILSLHIILSVTVASLKLLFLSSVPPVLVSFNSIFECCSKLSSCSIHLLPIY